VLLQSILAERRARWEADLRAKGKDPAKVRYEEPAAPDLTDLPELPEGWVWATLDQCFKVERGRFSIRPRNDPSYYNGPYPFVQIGDL
jgi:type I restriction enzyme, S subunit